MIVIDFDSLKDNQRVRETVCKMVRQSISAVPNAEKLTYAPTQCIHWFSTKKITEKDLEREDLPTLGASFGTGKNILEYMKWMLSDINKFTIKNNMGAFRNFHNTTVITDSNLVEIKKMGASVILVSMFGGN